MPDVTYELAGHPLTLPADHELPRIRAALPQYGLNLGRVARAVYDVAGRLSVIDVGGNVGDSVAIIKGHAAAARVLTVEGHEPYLAYLRPNVAGLADVEVEPSFVAGGDTAGFADVDAVGGTARLVPAAAGGGSAQKPLAAILAAHPSFADAKLFKVDTDGLDVSIVLAVLDYVRRVRPAIFLEYDPSLTTPPRTPAKALWEPLRAIGYRYAMVWENAGFYLGCMDASDGLTGDEVDAAASGWNTQRYFDLCLIHADDAAIADRARRDEVEYARTAPRYGTAAELPLHERYPGRQLGSALIRSALRRVTR